MANQNHNLYFEVPQLTPQLLLEMYPHGFFPWYSEGEPIRCFNPAVRCVLHPERLQLSPRTNRYVRQLQYSSAFDSDFHGVISHCATAKRTGEEGTWITGELRDAFCDLFTQGWAHSFEIYRNGTLCGGLYGLWIGGIFYGESMFSLANQASIVALANLCSFARLNGIRLIDCQIENPHLLRHGAELLSQRKFLSLLATESASVSPLLL